ncbi:MAG: hypothetical protein JNL08_00900 [Planctomycetes bacterium]|nr:hypothetical protein [Planctomycetota bacterium]
MGHLLDLISSKTLYLPYIHRWEDPYENILRHALKFTDRGVATFGRLTHGMCALCFSEPPECAAMWRIYGTPAVKEPTADDLSVRVEFCLGTLLDQIWHHVGAEHAKTTVWAGRLTYLDEAALRQQVSDLVDATDGTPGTALLDPTNRRIAETLFLKRRAFAFEREVRILVDPRFHDADSRTDGDESIGVRVPLLILPRESGHPDRSREAPEGR